MKLALDGFLNKVGTMAKHDRTEAVQDVDVFVAVHVPEPRTLGAIREDRLDDFFPCYAEAVNHSRSSEGRAILFRHGLRLSCALRITLGKSAQVFLLPLG